PRRSRARGAEDAAVQRRGERLPHTFPFSARAPSVPEQRPSEPRPLRNGISQPYGAVRMVFVDPIMARQSTLRRKDLLRIAHPDAPGTLSTKKKSRARTWSDGKECDEEGPPAESCSARPRETKGGPTQCCTPDWISAASVSISACSISWARRSRSAL